jgi:hypothetical protein
LLTTLQLERLGQRHAANEVGRLSSKIVDVYLKALADVSQGENANEDMVSPLIVCHLNKKPTTKTYIRNLTPVTTW